MNPWEIPYRNKSCIGLLSLICISGLLLNFGLILELDYFSMVWRMASVPRYRGILASDNKTDNGLEEIFKNVVVLMWSPFFGFNGESAMTILGIHNGSYPNCFRNCEISYDRSLLHQADAVVFHAWSSDLRKADLPSFRESRQLWVLLDQESPILANPDLDSFSGLFNWTMTYRTDSDVFHPYGKVEQIPDSFQNKSKIQAEIDFLLSGKTKLVAGAISKCQTHSKREKLVSQLRQHIPVDIYGKCGIRSCKRGSKTCVEDDFWKNLTRQYKFYLAFENSLCADYVTEKFFRSLELGLVPVVYGGANYTQVAPPHSFIDVSDFKSFSEMAEFLLRLDKNLSEYRKYFEWRLKYRVRQGDGYCSLCKKLKKHRLEISKLGRALPSSRTYQYLKSWWHYYPPPAKSLPDRMQLEDNSIISSLNACSDARY